MKRNEVNSKNSQNISGIFGERLKDILCKMNISQSSFARFTGIPLTSLNRYLNGKTLPTITVVIQIAITLNISLDYLLGFSNKPRVLHHRKQGRPMGRNVRSITTFTEPEYISFITSETKETIGKEIN